MLDWISSFFTDLGTTGKTVFTVIAFFVFIWSSHKGGWTAARVIISALVAAGACALVYNLDIFAKRLETDIKAAPAVVVTYDPATNSQDGPGQGVAA